MFDTNFLFVPGTLTVVLDASAGSSGKGKIGSFITQNANNWQFALNTFAPQAGHWVRFRDGRKYFYQTLNSCAYQHDRYEKLYIAPGSTIELPSFWREMDENHVPHHKVGISPVTSILQDIDGAFERGEVDFDGNPVKFHDGTMKTGTTAHGVGANRARRILRRKEAKYARDVPELKEFLCDVPREVIDRLGSGQSGLLEIAQGFQLSYLIPEFFPYTTSRNCTTMAGCDDAMIPIHYVHNVLLNLRTYPIRINNRKFLDGDTRKHLTWDEVLEHQKSGKKVITIEGSSGPGYPDQEETSWEKVTEESGSMDPIMEMTSVTKLPRRIFTFSKSNLKDAIMFNRANGMTYISLNFMNYVDAGIAGMNGNYKVSRLNEKVQDWIRNNLHYSQIAMLKFIGTGPYYEDQIMIKG
jgi:adenylosuccinate synthase